MIINQILPKQKAHRTPEVGKAAVLLAAAMLFLSGLLNGQPVTFTNVAASQGINHVYLHGNLWGGGISFADFDGDGDDDLTFASGPGEAAYFYQNSGSGFTNIGAQLAINDLMESESVLWADYDNDGDRDFFVSNFEGVSKLYRNEGNMQFTEVTTAAGLTTDTLQLSASCWGDYDNDGWLDLYVTNRSPVQPNILYHSRGDGTFENVTAMAGVGDTVQSPLAVAFLDYNNDGWQDIYIANDRGRGNTLFRNEGNGTFTDVSVQSGTDLHYDAMGIAIGDYDRDGDLDMYVSNGPAGNGLLRNNGDGTFSEIAAQLGLSVNRICWGVTFFDYDNDGDLDLYVCVSGGTPDRNNVLFENNGDGTFARTAGIGLDGDAYESFSSAVGDFDGNGYPDIAVLNETQPSCLWQNSGGANHWIKISLQGTISNRDGAGSRIELYQNGTGTVRSTHLGLGYLDQNSTVQTIGLGGLTTVDSVIVRWPSGTVDVLASPVIDSHYHIVEGGAVTGLDPSPQIPAQIILHQNYPNPFNPLTHVRFRLPEAAYVELKIFDLLGREVKTLIAGNRSAGEHQTQWDGTGRRGNPLGSGVYVYRLSVRLQTSAGIIRQQAARKMLLLR